MLVDGGSASASEILAGAIQDNNRGVLVGTKTFGKGLVQSVRGLGDGSGLAVAIANILPPMGAILISQELPQMCGWNLDPQKEALVRDREKIGTAADPQYAKALAVLNQEIATKRSPRAESRR